MYDLYTDGSVFDRGGWAYVLVGPHAIIEGQGPTSVKDNNGVELMAVLEGLRRIVQPAVVRIHSDNDCVNSRARTKNSLINHYLDQFQPYYRIHKLVFVRVDGEREHRRAHNLSREAACYGTTNCTVTPRQFKDSD